MSEKLVLSLVLNFLKRLIIDNVKIELIVKTAVDHYNRDVIVQAKKTTKC